MWYVGLDVHQRMSCVCILDEHGKIVKERRIGGPWADVFKVLRQIPERFAICYEASIGYGFLHDELRRVAHQVVVAHPGKLRLIFRSKRKNDRIDARKLALLLMLEQVPTVHVPCADVRGWRSLIEFRRRLVDRRTRAKNALRSLLKGYGILGPAGKRLWTAAGRAWLAGLDLPAEAAIQRDMLLEEMEQLAPRVRRVEAALKARADRHPGVYLLRTIPGVGIRTAEAVVAYIDDAARFARNKQAGAYFGLIPCEDTSVKQRLGHITCDGPATVRKLLVESAWQAVRRCPAIRARFERIEGRDRDRRKIAIVAIAHYLARVMLAMLRTGEAWRAEPESVAA
jgi:transposase